MENFKKELISSRFNLVKLLICKKNYNKEQLEEIKQYLVLMNEIEKELSNNKTYNNDKLELVKVYMSKVK